jgi:hypothetical protein
MFVILSRDDVDVEVVVLAASRRSSFGTVNPWLDEERPADQPEHAENVSLGGPATSAPLPAADRAVLFQH